MPTIEEMCEYLKNDWYFADHFFFAESNNWQNYREGTFEPLYDFQGTIAETCENNNVVWIQASRGSSKSYSIARWVVSYCLRNPMQAVVIVAPSFRQSRMLYDYCVRIIKTNSQIDSLLYKLEADISQDNMKRGHEVIMTFVNGSTIEALPAGNGDTLRGKRATVLICDEFYLFPKEIYVSHIMPFLNVEKGDKPAKVIHLTTSWYQDCYAYSVFEDIARYVKETRPGYAILDITIEDVIYSERVVFEDEPAETKKHFPASLPIILHQLETGTDKVTGRLGDEARMTFFNEWIKSSAAWYRSDKIDECRDPEVAVLDQIPKGWTTPFVLGVDPAGQGSDSTQMCVGSLPGDDRRYVHAVYKWEKLSPEAIAGYIHKMVDLYAGLKWIVLDKSGTLGADVAAKCASEKQLIDGIWVDRIPITPHDHPQAGLARAHIVLTRPSDEKIIQGFYGPRVDSTIGGELELKNAFHRDMKSRIENGSFKMPASVKDAEYFKDGPTNKGELLDNIREAAGQLPKIDRETDKETKVVRTDGKGNFYFTRPPRDDGAYSMIYMNYCANIVYREIARKRPDPQTRWSSLDRKAGDEPDTHMVVSPRLY